jgi:hypothetical protein
MITLTRSVLLMPYGRLLAPRMSQSKSITERMLSNTRASTRRHVLALPKQTLPGDTQPRVYESLTNSPNWSKIEDALTNVLGYQGRSGGFLIEEAAAYIAEGKHEELGITQEESEDFLRRWFESYAQKNGRGSLKKFKELSELRSQLPLLAKR